jgi:probable F420-dependent oxidoreductase
VKIDASLGKDPTGAAATARELEEAGYDGIQVGETQHDPFLLSLQAAQTTRDAIISTSVAIAFGRSPLTLAHTAYDLALYSQGRFVLGLGSQIKPHIEKRFSMPWSHPAARMRELVQAMRAIWDCWEDGTKLEFRGRFYTHTLMTPFFSPDPHAYGPPPVHLAGVGELMTEVAGEVCDGFIFHPLTTPQYLQQVTLPALERGRKKAGSTLDGFDIVGPAFVAVGRDEEELARAIAGTRSQIAFYASTPAYRSVLELHGWGDLQPELTSLTKAGRWAELGDHIDDEVLHAFAEVGDPAAVAAGVRRRFGDVATRISLYATYRSDPAVFQEVARLLR